MKIHKIKIYSGISTVEKFNITLHYTNYKYISAHLIFDYLIASTSHGIL